MGSLKLVTVEVLIPWKSENATNQGVKSTPRASCYALTRIPLSGHFVGKWLVGLDLAQ